MNYDPKVYELIKHFLEAVPEKNTERNRQLLARLAAPGAEGRPAREAAG